MSSVKKVEAAFRKGMNMSKELSKIKSIEHNILDRSKLIQVDNG